MAKKRRIPAVVVALLIVAVAVTACSSSSKSGKEAHDEVSFATKIEPLFQEKCQTCHREGGIAPFSLVTYEQVKAMGEVAKDKVAQREMPPWGAFNDAACTVSHEYKDNLSLTQEQIDMFVGWVDRGMPRGDISKLNPATPTPSPTGLIGKTNTYEVAAPYVLEAMGKDDIRCFPVDPGFEEDTWIGGSIVVPGDPKVVHHALVYVDPSRDGFKKAGTADSYPCFGGVDVKDSSLLLAWSPGGTATTYGANAGLRVPKNALFVMQVHYHPIATSTTGRMSIELKTLPEKPAHVAEFILVGNAESATEGSNPKLLPGPDDPPEGPAFLIPSNAKHHVESMEFVVPKGVPPTSLCAVGAHMHWAGVEMQIEVDRKAAVDGQPANECLLSMPKYDFNWQRTYAYDAPLAQVPMLRGGDKLRITCTYDNTTDNRYIARVMNELRMATPPEIRLGATSLDEMCQAILVLVH